MKQMNRSGWMVAVATLSLMLFGRCSGNPDIGLRDGKLAPCPKSPNCVSTRSDDQQHGIEALPFRGSRADTLAAILSVVAKMQRTTIITRSEDYLHVEYRTKMGFVDDVEFYLDAASQTVHFRSASRLGYSDFGVNRERMERFAALYRDLP